MKIKDQYARLIDLEELDGEIVAQAIKALQCDNKIKSDLMSLIMYFNHEKDCEV